MIEIVKIQILKTFGADKVSCYTTFPPTFYPWNENMILSFDCVSDTAEEYVAKNFPNIWVEVIDVRQL